MRVRYLPTGTGREIAGRETGEHYLFLPRSTGRDVVEVDERDLPYLLTLRGSACCGRGSGPIIDVIGPVA